MEPNTFPQLQLWCPRPFGTYTQNKPCPAPATTTTTTSTTTGSTTGTARKGFSCHPPATEVPIDASIPSENTPPVPPVPPAAAAAAPAAAAAAAPSGDAPPVPAAPPAEEGRVLLDTWYVIKPGNTKEKVAFFVAHQCGGGIGGGGIGAGTGTASRATTMKVKGNWSNDSSKAKRRRRCHDPAKGQLSPSWAAAGGKDPAEPPGDANPDLLSVAEMVALVEQRTALALQSFPRPCAGTATPVVIVETSDGSAPNAPAAAAAATSGAGTAGADCKRVAEAVAHFESRHRELGAPRPNGLCHPGAERGGTAAATAPTPTTTAAAASAPTVPAASPGEVRIAFRISSTRDARGGASAAEPGTGGGGRPNCVFMSCGPGGGAGGAGGAGGGRAKDKITCDLYQLISPSGDALPTNVELLLAAAGPKGDADAAKAEPGCGEGSAGVAQAEVGEGVGEAGPGSARDCSSGFHVDVVVTGVVDQCVFYGKDSAKKMKEETVTLPPQEEPPPPGQLFLLPPGAEEPCGGEDAGGGGGGAAASAASAASGGQEASSVGGDPALCRLYRHVSHDFLEIRFKIQRLLEPRQYLLLLPEHLMVKIFSYLPTQALAALKCSCHYFKSIIETFGVQATDSRWSRDPLYRDDPCKQCKKHYQRGDVSLCRWHPKPYHHDLPYGRSYWMCCRRPDREAPGCRVGLHDNNWVHPAPPRREEGR
ncbi:FBX46 protein, partial [Tricholaema leucomelas]|nr:FBX46 protein [Tricholaema leucomelas]